MKSGAWIAYVGLFTFPWGQPGSRRVYGICRSLVDAGYKVKVAAAQQGGGVAVRLNECPDIEYSEVGEVLPKAASRLEKGVQLFASSGSSTVEWLSSMKEPPYAVICYGGGAPFMHRVMRWCRSRSIPVIADVVEWYDPSHMQGGLFGPFHISAKIAMHYYFPRCDGIIAISTLLESHYKSKAVPEVIRIPPTLDTREITSSARTRVAGPLRLIYAGVPGKKDLLHTTILGVMQANASGAHFELRVVGPTEDQVRALMQWARIPACIKVIGTVPQQEVFRELQLAHFSILLREPHLFANAGFSTKLVESLANGVPVVGNLTSDMHLYLHDEVNGMICKDHSLGSLVDAFNRIKSKSALAIEQMRTEARKQAEDSFDYRSFVASAGAFMERLGK